MSDYLHPIDLHEARRQRRRDDRHDEEDFERRMADGFAMASDDDLVQDEAEVLYGGYAKDEIPEIKRRLEG